MIQLRVLIVFIFLPRAISLRIYNFHRNFTNGLTPHQCDLRSNQLFCFPPFSSSLYYMYSQRSLSSSFHCHSHFATNPRDIALEQGFVSSPPLPFHPDHWFPWRTGNSGYPTALSTVPYCCWGLTRWQRWGTYTLFFWRTSQDCWNQDVCYLHKRHSLLHCHRTSYRDQCTLYLYFQYRLTLCSSRQFLDIALGLILKL